MDSKFDLKAFGQGQYSKKPIAPEVKTGNIGVPQPTGGFDLKSFGAGQYSKSVSPTNNESAPKNPSFAGGIIRGVTKPVAEMGVNIRALGRLLSGKANTFDEAVDPIDSKYWGELKGVGLADEGGFSKENVLNSVGTGLDLASNLPMARGANLITKVAKQPFINTARNIARQGMKEGAGAAFLSSSGKQLQDDGKINIVKTAAETMAGAAGGYAFGFGGAGLSRATANMRGISKPLEYLKNRAVEKVQNAFRMTGKKPIKFSLDTPQNNVDGISVILKTAPFDYKNSTDITSDTLKATLTSKDSIFKEFDTIARQSGQDGVRIDTNKAIKFLENNYINKKGTTTPVINTALRLINDIQRSFPRGKAKPIDIQNLLKNLGEESSTPGSEKLSKHVIADFIGYNKKSLDNVLDNAGPEYFSLRQKYAKIKSVEDSLVKLYQKARASSPDTEIAKLVDNFNNAEMIAGIVSANPILVGKTLALRAGNKFLAKQRDPSNMLLEVFKIVDEMNTHPDFIPSYAPKIRTKKNPTQVPKSLNDMFKKEPYIPEDKLPVIQAGNKRRIPRKFDNLPTINF